MKKLIDTCIIATLCCTISSNPCFGPQVHCSGVCGDLNLDNIANEEDFLIVVGEYGTTTEWVADANSSRQCLEGIFSVDGYVDLYDIMAWDWFLYRQEFIPLCQLPITTNDILFNNTTTIQTSSYESAQVITYMNSMSDMTILSQTTNSLEDLLILGKRSFSEDLDQFKLKGRLYIFNSDAQYTGYSDPKFDRCNIRLVKDTENKLYQINSERGIIKLDGTDKVIVPPGQATYTNEPRYNKPATINIGIQNENVSPFGRPILDAAFYGDYMYVVPVVVSPEDEEAYLAAAKLRLFDTGNPSYQLVQLYDYSFDPNENLENNPRGIEIDEDGNVYVLNVHSLNESDILWKYDPNGTVLNRLDLCNPDSNSYLPDPLAMHVSDVTDMVYLTSGQTNEEAYVTTIYGLSKENLVLERSVVINGMHYVTGITEDPSTGTLWIIGFNMTDIPDYPNPTESPFYYPCLASIPLGSNDAQITALTGSYDLGLPMSIIWTGDIN